MANNPTGTKILTNDRTLQALPARVGKQTKYGPRKGTVPKGISIKTPNLGGK